ncbi:MAG: isoprenylcysteine carboxylmethyltransferase family protein [SAR324 cluster bacterium]|nr:isoprenylcysteine carboxylmethyltransferase family protein [SAR324 cluster bacterium]
MSVNDKDIPGVIAPPPLIYLGFLLGGFLIDYFLPRALLPNGLQYALGALLIAAGVILFALTIREFRRAGTALAPYKPSTAFVTSGPFRFSRNPLYLGTGFLYTGIAIAADSVWVLALLVPALVIMHYGVILREERYLEGKFGEDYRQYLASVRRWL